MVKTYLIVLTFLNFTFCTKESHKACWQGWSPLLFEVPGFIQCDKTKAELKAEYPGHYFSRESEEKYCWRANQTGDYYISIPQSVIEEYGSQYGWTFTKLDCNNICYCQWLEKHRSKITGLYNPNKMIAETFLAADTCSKLFVGRVITYRETADSIITRELTQKRP